LQRTHRKTHVHYWQGLSSPISAQAVVKLGKQNGSWPFTKKAADIAAYIEKSIHIAHHL
jgi:hypothetical protein